MNSVPFEFYESITCDLPGTLEIRDFPGVLGSAAAQGIDRFVSETILIENGKLVERSFHRLFSGKRQRPEEPVNQRFCLRTTIKIKADDAKYSTNPDALEAINTCKHRNVNLAIFTLNLCGELERSIDSFKKVSLLRFHSTQCVSKIMKMFSAKKTVANIIFPFNYRFDDATSALLLDALCQEQLTEIALSYSAPSVVSDIIAYWRMNPEKFTGKRVRALLLRSDVLKIGQGIRDATEQEIAYLQLYYPQMKPQKFCETRILRSEQGAAAYFIGGLTIFFT